MRRLSSPHFSGVFSVLPGLALAWLAALPLAAQDVRVGAPAGISSRSAATPIMTPKVLVTERFALKDVPLL
jgi:hypothetical protein